MNNLGKLPDVILHQRVGEATTVLIEQFASYGLTEDEVEVVDDANSQFDERINTAALLENDRKAAVAAKDAKREEVLDSFLPIVKKLYANPAVSDQMLAKIGLAERPTMGRRSTPQAPTQLDAVAFANGSVKLRWNRNGNTTATVFTIWASTPAGGWAQAWTGTTTRVTLNGFTPGVERSFKVTASVNNRTSADSNVETIYFGGDGVELDVAA